MRVFLRLADEPVDDAGHRSRARSRRRPARPPPCARRSRRRRAGSTRRCRRTPNARRTRTRAGTPRPMCRAIAAPHGLACLMMAHAGRPDGSMSCTSSQAASASYRFRYDNAMPACCVMPSHHGSAPCRRYERGRLVRVLAVPQLERHLLVRERQRVGQQLVAVEPLDDGGVVRRGVGERLAGEASPRCRSTSRRRRATRRARWS